MESAQPSTSPIASAWMAFVRDGAVDDELLRPEIAASWRRCRKAGLDPFAGRSGGLLEAEELNRLRGQHRNLIEVARPFMGNLYQFVASSSFVVVLCDERGYLVETVGAPEVIQRDPNLNFNPGALWTEAEVGTNGVGSALQLGRPFQVSGAEHYCRKHHPWTCSGAPILDDQGRMIGLLEMSGPVESTHQHTLGMVVAAVEAIQQQLRVQAKNRELMLVNSHLSNLFLTVSDGVVMLDPQGRIQQVNPVAEKLFALDGAALAGRPFAQFVERPEALFPRGQQTLSCTDVEINLRTGKRCACLASAKTIQDEQGHPTSHVVFLNPIHKLNKLINRFSGASATFTFRDIIGDGPALLRAVQQGSQAAASDSTVLLCGESGTGKEMFAQAIHNQSRRSGGPFIALNCGAIPRELVGSELFGYVEGAFTGAHKHGRPGKFELAAGGTLFLDEIGDMPLDQQVSLLRVFEDKSITRIGGDQMMRVDVRIIGATNKNLLDQIQKGNFRLDLYYRLNVIAIQLPPLRAHREDIPTLFAIFLDRFCRRLGLPTIPVDPQVLDRLQHYDWPGNIREFQNFVEKLINAPRQHWLEMASLAGAVAPALPAPAPAPMPPAPLIRDHRARIKQSLMTQERQEILDLMAQHRGNLSQVARALGISRSNLYKKFGHGLGI